MARPIRIQFQGAWYHVMHRGANRQTVFFDDKDRYLFLEILKEIADIYGVEVHVYCLMDNHYHLVLHTPRGNLSVAMRHLNSKYTQKVNVRHKRDGALFRGRYKAIVIGADDYLLNVSRYIHLNPLKAQLVKKLHQYRWSSYRYYAKQGTPPLWLITREIKKRFGRNQFQSRYKKYVEEGEDEMIEEFYNSPKFQPVLGGETFREFLFDQAKAHSLSAEIVGANQIIIPPTIELIIQAVSMHYNIDSSTIIQRMRRKIKNPARKVAIYLCRKVGGCSLVEIAKIMGGVAYTTISNLIKNTENDKCLMEVIEVLTKNLKTAVGRLSDK